MPIIDFRCLSCSHVFEANRPIADWSNTPPCVECGAATEQIHVSSQEYRPFKPYFDVGLGVQIDSFAQRERVKRQQNADFKDQPRKGDLSARQDKRREIERERSR